MKKFAFVITTINVPTLMDGYIENLKKYGHEDEVKIDVIVIGDTKTPHDVCGQYVRSLTSGNIEGIYLGVEEQKEWLKRFPELDALLPWKSVQRRNIGTIIAYERDADIIVQLDDDNFSTDDDWVKYMSAVGEKSSDLDIVEGENGWFNVCDFVKVEPSRRFYHRGYPHTLRWKEEKNVWRKKSGSRVVVNAGFWLESPDVDALTHLDGPMKSLGYKDENQPQFGLESGTWSPFNTQNTAFHRDTVPAQYCLVMCKRINGIYVERYDDIWLSYFLRKISDHLGDTVTYGRPFAAHRRNFHNIIYDMKAEADGILITPKLVDTLRRIVLNGGNYHSCYQEIIDGIRADLDVNTAYTADEKEYMKDLTAGMQVWSNVCAKIIKK